MVWKIALNVWLLFVGLDWRGDIKATANTLSTGAVIVVVIFVLELVYNHRGEWARR